MGIRQVRKSLATATSESMSSKWFNGGGLSLLVKAEGIHSKCFQFVFPDECELVAWSLEDSFGPISHFEKIYRAVRFEPVYARS